MISEENLPLLGVKVLDLTTVVFGPYTTQILGDFGADVIKIEAPAGDSMRHIGPFRNEGMSSIFLGSNRNKRSLVLNLKTEKGQEALWRLVEVSDMFVHNIRPQKIRALGFGPETVCQRNSKIIYGGLHGYREAGPYGGKPAYDDIIQCISGLAGIFAERDGSPAMVPSIIADKTAALMAANGLISAYVKRLRTGKGSYVECSMFEALASFNLVEHQSGETFSPPMDKIGYGRVLSKYRRPHRTKNGFIAVLPYTDKHWSDFWAVVNSPDCASDQRFSSMARRSENIDILYEKLAELLIARDTEEWLHLLTKADIPASPVNRLADLKSDGHLHDIGFFREYEHPSEGLLTAPDTPYQFDGESLPIREHQPQLGEHSRQILSEIGFSEEEIAEIIND